MALVVDTRLREDAYRSWLRVTHFDGSRFDATYSVVPLGKGSAAASGLATDGSRSVLKGNVVTDADTSNAQPHEKVAVVRGRWRHYLHSSVPCSCFTSDRNLPTGDFEMTFCSGVGTASGWWKLDDSDTHYPWTWRQIWLDGLIHGPPMARFAVGSAWIFAAMTAGSLGIAIADATEDRRSIVFNLAFNAIYALLYAVFVIAYHLSRKWSRPLLEYHAGVVLYTGGYTAFLVLYCITISPLEQPWVDDALASCYVAGSVLFLVGSILLAHSTSPFRWARGCTGKSSTPHGEAAQRAIARANGPISLFFGSSMFLVGSVFFTADSVLAEPRLTQSFVITGLSCFLLGRFFFLHGSASDECDIFFRNRTASSVASNDSTSSLR